MWLIGTKGHNVFNACDPDCPIREMVRVIRDNMRAVRFGAIIREAMSVAKPRDYALGPGRPVQCAGRVVVPCFREAVTGVGQPHDALLPEKPVSHVLRCTPTTHALCHCDVMPMCGWMGLVRSKRTNRPAAHRFPCQEVDHRGSRAARLCSWPNLCGDVISGSTRPAKARPRTDRRNAVLCRSPRTLAPPRASLDRGSPRRQAASSGITCAR
jgi:hypothetical protein